MSFSSCHRDIGIPISFQEDSGIVFFLSTELHVPVDLSRDVRTPVVMRQGSRAFSRVCTGDLDITSSFEMKDEPAFKSLNGNPAFFRVRESLCSFHLWQPSQGPSHIPTAERSLLLRCMWKVGLPLE